MEGISKQYLKNSLVSIEDAPIDDVIKSAFAILVEKLIAECTELQEPWMTLEEFLKSGFEGLCWIALTNKFVFECRYQEWDFIVKNGCVNYESITHVMPIHKPEPPK